MRLLVDENIPFAKEIFGQIGDIVLINGREITNRILKDFDILIVRSITKVNEELLHNTKIKFIGTTTIGTDHIDIEYLNKNNIPFTNAPGCNANSVAEYVFSTIFNYCAEKRISIRNIKLGIVGVGNIGGRINKIANTIGIKTILNDPPLKEIHPNKYVDIDWLQNADIITIHTPLTKKGKYPTYHLFDRNKLKKLCKDKVLINAARGPVVDNMALLDEINSNNIKDVILDVWENEPNINVDLLKKVYLGTPHIAGYSFDGKINGTFMVYDKLCDILHIEKRAKKSDFIKNIVPEKIIYAKSYDTLEKTVANILKKVYNFDNDFKSLKKGIDNIGQTFDNIRKNYPRRFEFNHFTVKLEKKNMEVESILKALGFKIQNDNSIS